MSMHLKEGKETLSHSPSYPGRNIYTWFQLWLEEPYSKQIHAVWWLKCDGFFLVNFPSFQCLKMPNVQLDFKLLQQMFQFSLLPKPWFPDTRRKVNPCSCFCFDVPCYCYVKASCYHQHAILTEAILCLESYVVNLWLGGEHHFSIRILYMNMYSCKVQELLYNAQPAISNTSKFHKMHSLPFPTLACHSAKRGWAIQLWILEKEEKCSQKGASWWAGKLDPLKGTTATGERLSEWGETS